MAEQEQDQKTQEPTPKRNAEATRRGDVLQSKEFGTALMMLAAAAWLVLIGSLFVDSAAAIVKDALQFDKSAIDVFDPLSAFLHLIAPTLLPLFLLFFIAMIAAIAGPALLGSLGFRNEALAIRMNRMNPLAGIRRIFGLSGIVELSKAIAKVSVLGYLGYWLVSDDLRRLFSLGHQDIHQASKVLGHLVVTTFVYMALSLLAIALIDVPIQYVRRQARLKMTLQEVKDEQKQSEGSAELKQAIRQRQHTILNQSVRKAVTDANVIITNPSHFAVALRYDALQDFAPVVVARGRDGSALAIRELAAGEDIPVLEYPALTRAIYFSSRVGQTVSEDLYVAVATVLAFVFNLDRSMADTFAKPDIEVPSGKMFDENGKPMDIPK